MDNRDRSWNIIGFRQHGWTLERIGKEFGLSEEQVRQIIRKKFAEYDSGTAEDAERLRSMVDKSP